MFVIAGLFIFWRYTQEGPTKRICEKPAYRIYLEVEEVYRELHRCTEYPKGIPDNRYRSAEYHDDKQKMETTIVLVENPRNEPLALRDRREAGADLG